MKVFLIITHLSPILGMERSTLRLEEQLRKYYDVELVVVGGSNLRAAGQVPVSTLGSEISGFRRLLALPRLRRFAKKVSGDDVVILVGIWTALPWLLAVRRRVNSVVWEHTLMREKLPFSRKLRLLFALASKVYVRAAAIVAVSAPVAEDLRQFSSSGRVSVIPNFLSPSTGNRRDLKHISATSTADKQILCVGSLSRIKAQELALEALSELPSHYTMKMIGSGPREGHLRELAVTLKLQSRVEFCGFLEGDDIQRMMRESIVLLHTSVAETFGLVLIEAAEQGLPVLAVRTRTSQWLIPDYVPGWTTTRSSAAIAEAIKEIGPIPADHWRMAACRRDEDFDSDALTSQWRSVLDRIVLRGDAT